MAASKLDRGCPAHHHIRMQGASVRPSWPRQQCETTEQFSVHLAIPTPLKIAPISGSPADGTGDSGVFSHSPVMPAPKGTAQRRVLGKPPATSAPCHGPAVQPKGGLAFGNKEFPLLQDRRRSSCWRQGEGEWRSTVTTSSWSPEAAEWQRLYRITAPFGMCFQNSLSHQPLVPFLLCCAGLKHTQAMPWAVANSPQDRCAPPFLNAAGMSHHWARSYPAKHNPCGCPRWLLLAGLCSHCCTHGHSHGSSPLCLQITAIGTHVGHSNHTCSISIFFLIQDTIILAGVLPSKYIHFTFITLVYYLRALSLNARVDTLLLK